MFRSFSACTVALALAGCVGAAVPVISDFNGSSVKIQKSNTFGEGARTDATDAEAARICATNRKRAEFASQRALPGYVMEFLYLCL